MLQNNLTKMLAAALIVAPMCGCSVDSLKDAANFASSSGTEAKKRQLMLKLSV